MKSPNFKVARKQFHYELGKSEALQKKIDLQCYLNIPQRVTFLYDSLIHFDENKDVFKYLNYFSPLDDWFTYEYIDAEVKNKVYKTKRQLAGDEIEKETKHYVESLNHDPNWLNTVTIEIDKFLVDCEYIDFFMQIYMHWSKDSGPTSSLQKHYHSTSASF